MIEIISIKLSPWLIFLACHAKFILGFQKFDEYKCDKHPKISASKPLHHIFKDESSRIFGIRYPLWGITYSQLPLSL
jgi:hypothetical protein